MEKVLNKKQKALLTHLLQKTVFLSNLTKVVNFPAHDRTTNERKFEMFDSTINFFREEDTLVNDSII